MTVADPITATIRAVWGHEALRPLQREAIEAGLAARDSLVVMPTGGGKSLCYQVPPLLAHRLDVVVSPLIALMQDQVDALAACDYPAMAIHSGLEPAERQEAVQALRSGRCRLLFVSPERLLLPGFLDFLESCGVRSFAIDEAHCISHWGHDFRPEYRQLATLRDRFPHASLHAYTATATPRVRQDIVEQLRLRDPTVLVGDFDRPNLVYRVVPKVDAVRQVQAVLERHRGEAAIVYCMSRRDTDHMADALRGAGFRAEPYHAGLPIEERRATQQRFSEEAIDVVVATVAFGMGVDRSDVRTVIHAGLPKSVEAYQQETGRAGRDGLPAECVLLYSYADVVRWESLLQRSHDEAMAEHPEQAASLRENLEAQLALLRQVSSLCGGARCRHAALCEHFGQPYERRGCGACDVCLGEIETLPDATTTARKILSAVARVRESFGVMHVADVLVGADTEAVRRHGHDALSVHGLLRSFPKAHVVNLVHQLLDHGLLERTPGDRPTIMLSPRGRAVMRGEGEVVLRQPATRRKAKRSAAEVQSWSGVDRALFEHLRAVRRRLALERGVAPYIVFGDETLRELARGRPASVAEFAEVRGVGQRKLEEYGELFVAEIAAFCREHGVARTAAPASPGDA